jgi:hypothetical protein
VQGGLGCEALLATAGEPVLYGRCLDLSERSELSQGKPQPAFNCLDVFGRSAVVPETLEEIIDLFVDA